MLIVQRFKYIWWFPTKSTNEPIAVLHRKQSILNIKYPI